MVMFSQGIQLHTLLFCEGLAALDDKERGRETPEAQAETSPEIHRASGLLPSLVQLANRSQTTCQGDRQRRNNLIVLPDHCAHDILINDFGPYTSYTQRNHDVQCETDVFEMPTRCCLLVIAGTEHLDTPPGHGLLIGIYIYIYEYIYIYIYIHTYICMDLQARDTP